MNEAMKEKLRSIADFSKREIGDSEESIKINFVVPVLECFGHKRLDFEYKYKDIIIKKDLSRFCKVILETKNYDKDLKKELQQLERYCNEEHPLLGIIANGHEIRIFSPSWRFRNTFQETIIYCINQKDLKDDNIVLFLEKTLSRENLENGKAKEFVIERENEIEYDEQKIEKIEKEFKKEEEELTVKIGELNQKIEVIRAEMNYLSTQISDSRSNRDRQIREVWKRLGLPAPLVTQIPLITTVYPQTISTSDIQVIRTRNVYYKYADRIEIILNNLHSPRKYNLIPISRECRSLFPGYKVSFILNTDIGEVTTNVTAGKGKPEIGDPEAGDYISGGLKPWYDKHRELKEGNKLIIEVIEPKKRYRLSISE